MDDCKNEENSVCWKGSTVEDHEENSVCWKGSTVEDLESAFNNLFILESEIESWKPACCELVSRERKLVETKSSYKANKVATKSLSLDEVTTSVASNSLNVLGIDHSQFGSEFRRLLEFPFPIHVTLQSSVFGSLLIPIPFTSASPLRRFGLRFCYSVFVNSHPSLRSSALKFKTQVIVFASVCFASAGFKTINKYSSEGLPPLPVTLSLAFSMKKMMNGKALVRHLAACEIMGVAEQEHPRASQLLCRRRKVKALEDLETEALIRKWGLDEEVFNC
ncbi:hypothetical protein NC652_039528 [Populus alba x Populus x berolinensis]|nr:hypothetical protein NC652_039528 [Populus alba x Populus x berolinensis]